MGLLQTEGGEGKIGEQRNQSSMGDVLIYIECQLVRGSIKRYVLPAIGGLARGLNARKKE